MFVGVPSRYTGYISLVLNAYVLIIVFYEISLKYFYQHACNKRILFIRSSCNDQYYPIGHTEIWSYTGRRYITNNSKSTFNEIRDT